MDPTPVDSPWYKEGLHFQCTECGKCCTGPPGYVWVTEEEITKMALFLQIPLDLFHRKYLRQKYQRYALIEKKMVDTPGEWSCIFLKDKKCSIYSVRPEQCRTFPWWQENLNSEESWKEAAVRCEGITPSAPLTSFEEILKRFKN